MTDVNSEGKQHNKPYYHECHETASSLPVKAVNYSA